jgi:hypothetical protein
MHKQNCIYVTAFQLTFNYNLIKVLLKFMASMYIHVTTYLSADTARISSKLTLCLLIESSKSTLQDTRSCRQIDRHHFDFTESMHAGNANLSKYQDWYHHPHSFFSYMLHIWESITEGERDYLQSKIYYHMQFQDSILDSIIVTGSKYERKGTRTNTMISNLPNSNF